LTTQDEFPFAGPVKEEKKWDAIPATKKDWFATVFIFLLPPFGLYFLWRGKLYWRRNGKPTVVSGARKFILSIPAALIMLIAVTFALDLPSTEIDGDRVGSVAEANVVPAERAAAYQARFDVWFNQCQAATRDQLDTAKLDPDVQVVAARSRDRCVRGVADIRPFAVSVMGERCGRAIDATPDMLDGVHQNMTIGSAMVSGAQSDDGAQKFDDAMALHTRWLNGMRACGINPAAMGVE